MASSCTRAASRACSSRRPWSAASAISSSMPPSSARRISRSAFRCSPSVVRITSSCGDRLVDSRLEHLQQLCDHRRIALDRAFANRQRLRQPQQIARRQQSLNDAAASGGLERRRQRHRERLVELDFNAGGVAILHVHRQLHPPATDSTLDARANAPFGLGQRLRHAKLQIEMPMVDRANGHRRSSPCRSPASARRIRSCS